MVLTTLDERTAAMGMARSLVDEGLAACVHLLPAGTSVYVWEGEVAEDTEYTLLIKTRQDLYPDLEAAILERHPYEVPEILALPVQDGLPDYLDWVAASTGEDE